MKYNLIYFDDQPQNIECYSALLNSRFDVIGCIESINYDEVLKSTKKRPHALMIDVHMPVLDGPKLYEKILLSPFYNGCPVFFISGDESDELRLNTIKSGAVDFFDRKVKEEELIVRLIGRINLYLQGASILELGNLKVNTKSYQAFVDETPISLTLVETRILCMLLRSPAAPLSRKSVMENVWGPSSGSGKMFTHLSNLGVKLWDWDHSIKVKGEEIFLIPSQ